MTDLNLDNKNPEVIRVSIIKRYAEEMVDLMRNGGVYPDNGFVQGVSTGPEIVINGRRMISTCTSNYLDLAADPRVKKAIKKAVDIYGLGACGSRILSGNLEIHHDLEEAIAAYKKYDDAIIYSTGTLTNMGVIPSAMNPPLVSILAQLFPKHRSTIIRDGKKIIFSDIENHASIADACKLAGVETHYYRHCDMDSLEKLLKRFPVKYKLIITDGVFSSDGDIVPLPKILALAEAYEADVMVDDAHGTGILGKNGRGTCEHFNVEDKVAIHMGTLSKAFGGQGGFIVGDKKFIDYLRVESRSYMFTGALPPAISAGIITAIKIATEEPWRRKRLLENADYLRNGLKEIGYDTLNSETQIISVLIGDELLAIKGAKYLADHYGVFAPPFRYPAAPKGKARIRLNVTAAHTKDHLSQILYAFDQLPYKPKIIQVA